MATFRLRVDSKSVSENRIQTGNVLANDIGAITVTHIRLGSDSVVPVISDGTVLTATYGVLTIRPDGSYTYESSTAQSDSLAAGVNGNDVFTYTAVNSSGASATTTLSFAVTGKNDAPVLVSTTATLSPITEDAIDNGGQAVSTFLNSSDVDSGALSGIAIRGLTSSTGTWQYSLDGGANWSNVGTVSNSSSLLLRSTDFIRFVPDGIQSTTASFTYRAWDQSTGTAGAKASSSSSGGENAYSTAIGTASIVVAAVNDPPVAGDDSATTAFNTAVLLDVLSNDHDADGGTLAITESQQASNGTVVVQNGKILYTPNTGYIGEDSFTYTASDGQGGSAVASVTVTVRPPNQAPTATADTAATIKDTLVTIDVLANDTDPDGDTLSIVSVAAGSNGTAIVQAGKVVYTPNSGFVGSDTFTYTMSDGQGGSAIGNVSVSVAPPPNSAPTANDDIAATTTDTATLINVLANDSDADSDVLSISNLSAATNGVVAINNGQVSYTPNSGFSGLDSFTYTVSDGQGGTDVGNVSVSVGLASPTSAVTLTFRQGANGYLGTVDTMLKEKNSTIAFGNAFVITPDSDSGGRVQGLLAFTNLFGTGQEQVPLGATIISATLTLHTSNSTPNAGTLHRMLTDWNGLSTWSNKGSGIQVGTEASTSGALALGAAAVGTQTYDVTGSLQTWLAAGTTSSAQNAANLGWLFQPGSTDDWNFGSANGSFAPSLVISYIPAGSPSTPPALPSASISGPATGSLRVEGGQIAFTLSLNQASTENVTLSYSTADGTAKAGADYLAASGTLTFLAGETSKQVLVQLVNDSMAERPEGFSVQITSATNAKVGTAFAKATITDNDIFTLPMPSIVASVVAVHNIANGTTYQDGSGGTYGISDPSAIAYIPGLDLLYIGDSEHDESPFNSSVNMFALRTDGSYVRNHSLRSFTDEPTGLAYNSNNGLLYVADDDDHGVYWTDPMSPSGRLGYFDTRPLGFADTEDLKIDPVTGHIHVLDGVLRQIIELTITGVFVDSIPLPSIMRDAEALAYHPTYDLFFVASGASKSIWVIDRAGTIRATLDVLSGYSPEIKGFELAPSSNPNDGDTLSLYVADYGLDQVNDGRLFEVNLGPDWFL
jgi:VCBS repeat-containing protein